MLQTLDASQMFDRILFISTLVTVSARRSALNPDGTGSLLDNLCFSLEVEKRPATRRIIRHSTVLKFLLLPIGPSHALKSKYCTVHRISKWNNTE